jgi:uncharacterized protein with ParB-like and HNH nuclease domain
MKFSDIKMLTPSGNYEVNIPLDDLERAIAHYQEIHDVHPPLDLLPDFQRGHVWTEAQQIAYIEFFLRGGMSGRVIYLNCPNWGHFNKIKKGGYRDFVIVDGLQRLTALMKFVRGELPAFGHYVFPKEGQSVVMEGRSYFGDRIRMSDACNNIRININNLTTRDAVLKWYLEMNSGGTPHTQEELNKVKRMIEEEKK